MQRPVRLLFKALMLLPLGAGLSYSFLYSVGLLGIEQGVTLKYWEKLIFQSDALISLAFTVYLTGASLFLIVLFALLLAWWHHRRPSGTFYKLLFLPLTFPPLIAAFLWYNILSPSGIISRLFYSVGLTGSVNDFPRLVNDPFAIGILVTHIFLVFPLFTILFIDQAKKENISGLAAVSSTLGGSQWQFFRLVFVPLILKKSRMLIVLYSIFLLGTYEVPLLLGRSSPRVVTLFITEQLTKFDLNNLPLGHAMAIVYSLVVILIITLSVPKNTTFRI